MTHTLETWVAHIEQKLKDEHKASGFNWDISLYINPGRNTRFAKIVMENAPAQRSVHCFVERATGNIYMAASWKAASTKHVRGNINDPDGSWGKGVQRFGAGGIS